MSDISDSAGAGAGAGAGAEAGAGAGAGAETEAEARARAEVEARAGAEAGARAGAGAGAITGAVARAVQALRAERGWSLDQLAARSGVSKGVLVALEQRRSNPNLATLARIGDAFGVPVTRLVEVGAEPVVQLTGGRILWNGAHGGTGTILAATDPPWATELWRWELRPGESFGGEAHTLGTREMAWVEQGTLTLTVAGERHRLTAGQCARFHGGQQHGYANEGDATVLLTMVVVIPPAQP